MTGAEPLLTLRGLRHSYAPGQTVLSLPALALARGEIVLLTGDNGAGKSTLLRILAGLQKPARCDFFDFAGKPKAAPPQAVYLHQTPYLFSGTARANVEYGLRCCRLPLRRADEAMQWAGIDHIADRPAHQLSGGDQRRVALARVRALRPQLYLLDEPLTHLDSAGAARVRALLAALSEEGATAIISSHHSDLPATAEWRLAGGALSIGAVPPPPR